MAKTLTFGKSIKTEEQNKIYNKVKEIKLEIKRTEAEKEIQTEEYYRLEGKYSNGTKEDPWAGQGFRGWFYTYESEELKIKAETEREEFYQNNVKPLADKIGELYNELEEAEEQLCIALWGFGKNKYYKLENIVRAKNRIAHYKDLIEKEKKYIEELEKDFE